MVNVLPVSGRKAANENNGDRPDFRITYHGTVGTLDLLTDVARQWAEANLEIEPWQWLSAAGAAGKYRLAIDPRSMEIIGTAMREAGFTEG